MLDPSWVVPLVAILVHKECRENGGIFEVGGGHFAKYRWERSKGAILSRDSNFSAGALLRRWNEVNDFRGAEYPDDPFSLSELEQNLKSASPNPKTENLDFTGRAVLVTGGGAG